jgi:hypothetical protein
MPKNFLDVKGMTLMGEVEIEIKRFASKYIATHAVLFLCGRGQSSGNMIQVTMLTVDVAPKLKFNGGSKTLPW